MSLTLVQHFHLSENTTPAVSWPFLNDLQGEKKGRLGSKPNEKQHTKVKTAP